ncbi:MAG: DUF493 domain-containing protein [Gammaproteobacteria bacterium]|nr:DUF493 domain-containing protein [Gammaproteobacteria bacterium]MBT8151829.1 DUF493 domain-containing protein [Gammaproteobacteria bacterium]NNM11696.1 DUF493 domain-containing protein [Pseudomonadales bacterium]
MSKLIGIDGIEKGAGSGEAAPKIEFPCDYPIKVLGRSGENFTANVTEVVREHDPGFDPATISHRDSRHGAFCAITLTIRATGSEQLEALHLSLRRIDAVKMVL